MVNCNRKAVVENVVYEEKRAELAILSFYECWEILEIMKKFYRLESAVYYLSRVLRYAEG